MEKEEIQDKKKLTLVLPVYNEGDGVIPVIATLFLSVNYPLKLVVVYDSEEDTTIATVRKMQKYFKDIHLLRNEWKSGALNAVKTGFKNADTEYVGIWLSYHVDPFGILNEMLAKMEEGYDLVSANRFANKTERARGNPVKKSLSLLGNVVLDKIIGMPITDVTTSVKLFRKSLLDAIPIETVVDGGWAMSAEIAIKAVMKGYRLAEVPLERRNINLIHGLTNFRVFKQLPEYFRWLYLGWNNRHLIKSQLNKH